MPIWLLGAVSGARSFVRSIPPVVWYILAALALVFVIYRVGVSSGKTAQRATDSKVIEPLRRDLATSLGNVVTLRKAIADQNAATDALAADGAARQQAAQDALRKAQEREKAQAGLVARLAANGAHRPATPCPVSKVNQEASSDAL